MRTLFAISMLCFFTLLTAILMLVRKVLQAQQIVDRQRELQRRRSFENRLRARQDASPLPRYRPDTEEATLADRYADHQNLAYNIAGQVVSGSQYARSVPQQQLEDLIPAKSPDWRFMVHERDASSAPSPGPFAPGRPKGPQPSHFGTRERLDWAYFNKDLGDLSDPYEPQRFTGTDTSAPPRPQPWRP